MPFAHLAVSVVTIAVAAACSPPEGVPAERVLRNIDAYIGRTIDMRAKFRSGARCHLEAPEWKTYCKDCQYCKGPMVVDLGTTTSTETEDWPMVLGGTYKYQDVRCKGPLNEIECYPFVLGKEYVVRGFIERYRPPRFIVQKFWPEP